MVSGSVTRNLLLSLLALAIVLGAALSSSARPRPRRDGKKSHWSKVKGISGKLAKDALEKAAADESQTTEDVEGASGGLLVTVGPRSPAQLRVDRARLKRALKTQPGDIDLLREYAGVALRLGDHDAALPAFLQVVKTRPSDVAARLELGGVLHERARYNEAMQQFLKVTDLAPKMFMGWMNLGISYRRLGLPARAVYAF